MVATNTQVQDLEGRTNEQEITPNLILSKLCENHEPGENQRLITIDSPRLFSHKCNVFCQMCYGIRAGA